MKEARFSDMAALEGAAILIQNFPMLRNDTPRALDLARQIAATMVLEDQGKKIIHTVHEEEAA